MLYETNIIKIQRFSCIQLLDCSVVFLYMDSTPLAKIRDPHNTGSPIYCFGFCMGVDSKMGKISGNALQQRQIYGRFVFNDAWIGIDLQH